MPYHGRNGDSSPDAVEYSPASHIVQLAELIEPVCVHNEPNQTDQAEAPLPAGADDSTNDFSPSRRRRHLRLEYNT